MKKILLFLIFFFIIQLNSNATYSYPPANKILIYTNTSNLTNGKDTDLVLFFGGFGFWSAYVFNDYSWGGLGLDPELGNISKYRENIIFASVDPELMTHWGWKKTILDIQNDIKNILRLFKIRNIYLIGGSMGGSSALNFSSITDKEIKDKIKGVLVYLPITDYDFTVKNTKDERIKSILINHFYNDKNKRFDIKESSPITHINNLPQNSKIKLIVGSEDTVAPPQQARDYYLKAKKLGKNISIQEVKAKHLSSDIKDIYKTLLEEMLK